MDRYEFNLKSQQMRKLAADGRYDEAALIADEIDWSRVKNTRLLMLTADIYEATEQPEKEYDILDIAYERSPMGKQLAYRLALVASELKDYEEAENYYKDYVDMAPKDSRRYLLRYRLSKARGEDLDLLIGLLERYLDDDMEERWTYELCELYAKAGYQQKCIDLCDELITWFGDGKYVLAALKLKKKYASLSVSQQQKYEDLKREAGEEPEDEEEVGVEIARTRNEIMRNRTLPEKMQAVAEKRMQEDAGNSEKRDKSEKDADGNAKAKKAKSQPSKKAKSGAKAKERERKPAPAAEETAEKSAVAERVTSPSESAPKSDGKDLSAGIAAGKDVSVGTAAGKNILAGTDPGKDISVGAAAGKYISTRTAPERELSEGITAGKNIPDGTSAGKVDGTTRRYDGSAVRRAEAATERRQADESAVESAEAAWRRTDENAAGRVTAGKKGPEEEGVAGKAQTGTQASYGNSAANRKSVEGTVVFDRDTANIRENAEAENTWEAPEVGPGVDADEIHIKTYSDRPYDTMNIQAELAKSMEAILRADEAKAAQKAAKRPGRQGSGPAVRTYVPPASGAAEEDPFGYEQERREPEKQITGQMSIEEILKDLQTRGILKEDTVENALRVTGQMPLWKVKEAETSEHDTDAEGETAEEKSEAERNEAEEGVTEESVVKEMEEISLRDFTTGEIDLEIVQNEVDEQHKATSEKQEDENVPEAREEADLPEEVKETALAEESESANFPEEAEASELTGNSGEVELPKEVGETDPEEESESANLPEEAEASELTENSGEAKFLDEVRETALAEGNESANLPEEENETALSEDMEEADLPEEAKETAPAEESESANLSEEENETGLPEVMEVADLPEEVKETAPAGESENASLPEEENETGLPEDMEEADLPEESENTNLSEVAEESELTGDSGEAELPKEAEEADPAAESEPEYLPEEVEDTDSQEEIEESGSQEESSEFDLAEESKESDFEQERKEAASDEAETSEAGEIEFAEGENRKSDTEDFLSGVELDLSRLGQEGNPYTQMRNEDEKRETEKMDDVFSVIREMETDLNEEDRIYNAYTEEEPKERRNLDEADRKEFEQYLKITGMETQIAKAISDYVTAYNNDGTSRNPNILITGGAKTGKSQLAVSLIRAINRHLGREGRKTARISGFNLNRKTLSASMPRLLGNDLLIEHAGEINRKIVAELMDILPKYTGGMIVVMEDEKSRLDHLFEDYPLLADYFPNHLDIKEYDINEWAAVAKSYARSQGYTIDELGTLALYAEIDALYGMLQGLEVDDIKDIVDEAIEHSERKMGAALAKIFGKKKDTGRKVLRETDFNA